VPLRLRQHRSRPSVDSSCDGVEDDVVRRVPLHLCLAVCGLWLSLHSIAGQGLPSESIGVRMIVVGSAEQAQRILDQLKGGADFAALAMEQSTDPTARDGGYLGQVDPATLRSELRDALTGVTGGQLTRVVRIPTGYAILEVLPDSQGIQGDDSPTPISVAAAGAVRDVINVGGLTEADAMFLAFPKKNGWNQDLREMCRVRTQSIPSILQKLEQNPSAPLSPDASTEERLEAMQAQYAWAQIHAYAGDMDKAIDRWERAKRIAEGGIPAVLSVMEATLGVAFLHKAEMDNGSYRTPGELCLLPRINSAIRDTRWCARRADPPQSIETPPGHAARRPRQPRGCARYAAARSHPPSGSTPGARRRTGRC